MNEKLDQIIDHLKVLTLLEARDLVKEIEKTFEVSVAQSFAMSMPTSAFAPTSIVEAEEEQSSFDVYLIEVPSDKKIAVLKIVRSATGLGLKESKEIVDTVPKLVKTGLSKEDTDSLKKEFEAVGAKVDIK